MLREPYTILLLLVDRYNPSQISNSRQAPGTEPAILFIRMTRLLIMILNTTEPDVLNGMEIPELNLTKTATEPDILKSKTAKKLFMIKTGNGLDIKDERQK